MKLLDALAEVATGVARGLRTLSKGADWGALASRHIVTPEEWNTGADVLNHPADTLRQPYAQHPTVYRAVRSIAQSIGQLEREMFPEGRGAEDDSIDDHWAIDLMRAPSETSRGDNLIDLTLTFLESCGEAFWWHREVARTTAGGITRPNQIWMLAPQSVAHDLDDNGQIKRWRYNRGDRIIDIPPELITFFKYPNPVDSMRGLAPLRAAMVEATGDWKMAQWNQGTFERSAIPPIVFSPADNQEWLEEDRERFLETWNAKIRGYSRVGTSAALPVGIKLDVLKATQTEMDFLQSRRFTREQILSVFGVPPAIAGVFEFANYANSREQMKFYWHNTLLPKLRYLQVVITMDFIRRYEQGTALYFKVEPVLADIAASDLQQKISSGLTVWGMGMPFAEVNETMALGFNTDPYPWLKEGWLPFSVQSAQEMVDAIGDDDDESELAPFEDPDEPTDPTDDPESREVRSGATISRRAIAEHRGKRGVSRADDKRKALWSGLAARWGDIGRSYGRDLRSWLFALKKEMLKNMSEIEPGVLEQALKPHRAEGAAYAIKVVNDDVMQEIIDQAIFEQTAADAHLVGISEKAWSKSIERGASTIGSEIGVAIDFNFLDPRVQSFLASKRTQIVGITRRIEKELVRSLTDGIQEGESLRDLAKRVQKRFKVERSRAITIARTETAQAFSTGRYESMKQAGVTHHWWLSSRDGNVRDNHDAIDGEGVVIGESFPIVGIPFPADPSGDPGEIINCRCVTIPGKGEGQR